MIRKYNPDEAEIEREEEYLRELVDNETPELHSISLDEPEEGDDDDW